MTAPLTWVDAQDAGNAQAQLILQAIARHADFETGEAHPSRERISMIAKCSKRTVNRYLDKLEADGLIERVPQSRANGSQTANVYRLVGYAEWAKAVYNGGSISKPKRVEKYAEPGCQSDKGGGCQADTRGVTPADTPRTSLEPSIEQVARPEARATQSAALPALLVRHTDVSWADWLDKIEETQGAAARAFVEKAGELSVPARFPRNAKFIPSINVPRDPTGEAAI